MAIKNSIRSCTLYLMLCSFSQSKVMLDLPALTKHATPAQLFTTPCGRQYQMLHLTYVSINQSLPLNFHFLILVQVGVRILKYNSETREEAETQNLT